jgi:hypothetical protein
LVAIERLELSETVERTLQACEFDIQSGRLWSLENQKAANNRCSGLIDII